MTAYDVAVIGAGTTGSSIAYFLTQRGLRPVVFEKTRAAGGPSGASAGMCRAHYSQPAIIDMAKHGCEFLADMKARTGFQSGYSMSGYLVVGPEERETAIRTTYEAMRERGVEVELCGVDRILELEPRLATARSRDRLLRADRRACAAAVRRGRLRARRRARRRDASGSARA